MTKERPERFALFHMRITLSLFLLTKNEGITRKTDERIPSPGTGVGMAYFRLSQEKYVGNRIGFALLSNGCQHC